MCVCVRRRVRVSACGVWLSSTHRDWIACDGDYLIVCRNRSLCCFTRCWGRMRNVGRCILEFIYMFGQFNIFGTCLTQLIINSGAIDYGDCDATHSSVFAVYRSQLPIAIANHTHSAAQRRCAENWLVGQCYYLWCLSDRVCGGQGAPGYLFTV